MNVLSRRGAGSTSGCGRADTISARGRWYFRPSLLALALAVVASYIFVGHVAAAALTQGADPILKPEAAPILKLVAAALPVINRYLTEWLRLTFPSMKSIDGRVLSRNVGVLLFIGFAITGVATRPDIALPTLPTSGDLFDYLDVAGVVITSLGAGLAWVVGGSRYVHASIKGDEEGPATPTDPAMSSGGGYSRR